MDLHSQHLYSPISISLPPEPSESMLSLPASSLSRLKYITSQITECSKSLSTQPHSSRKRLSLYSRIRSYEQNLELKIKMEEEQELLKKKVNMYRKELGRIEENRKENIKELLRSWSVPSREPRSRTHSFRFNTVSSKNKRVLNDENTLLDIKQASALKQPRNSQCQKNVKNGGRESKVINIHTSLLDDPRDPSYSVSENPHNDITIYASDKTAAKSTLPKRSKFSSKVFPTHSASSLKQNKLFGLFNKHPPKTPSNMTKTHSPQSKNNSFFQRRSNAYSVIIDRGRSVTKASDGYPSPKQIFKMEALQQINLIMNHSSYTFKEKMNKLMELKIKINNIQSDEAKDGNVGNRVKQSISQLYDQIIRK